MRRLMILLERRRRERRKSRRRQSYSVLPWMSSLRARRRIRGRRFQNPAVRSNCDTKTLAHKLPEQFTGMFAEAQRCYILRDFNRVRYLLFVLLVGKADAE